DGNEHPSIDDYACEKPSLRDHLEAQLGLVIDDPKDRLIGRYLIDQVDEAGYLRADLDEVAEKLGVGAAHIERVLGVLHTFEPAGVMARDLKECLALQLKDQGRLDPMMALFLDNLSMLGARNL